MFVESAFFSILAFSRTKRVIINLKIQALFALNHNKTQNLNEVCVFGTKSAVVPLKMRMPNMFLPKAPMPSPQGQCLFTQIHIPHTEISSYQH